MQKVGQGCVGAGALSAAGPNSAPEIEERKRSKTENGCKTTNRRTKLTAGAQNPGKASPPPVTVVAEGSSLVPSASGNHW